MEPGSKRASAAVSDPELGPQVPSALAGSVLKMVAKEKAIPKRPR
jgi:hypothetical protein